MYKRGSTLKIGVISDTHGIVRPSVHKAFKGVDQILHAGDIDTPEVIRELELIAPVTAVRGNMDAAYYFPHLPEQTTVRLGMLTAVVIHNHHKLQNLPKDTKLLICGHTHKQTWGELRPRLATRLHSKLSTSSPSYILNPGSAGERSKTPSVAVLTVNNSQISPKFIEV